MGSEIIFIVALIIAVVAVYWVVLKSSAEKIATQYQLLAERFGLELNQSAVKMRGFIRSNLRSSELIEVERCLFPSLERV